MIEPWNRRYAYVLVLGLVCGSGLWGCQSSQQIAHDGPLMPASMVRSDLPRITDPQVSETDQQTLIADNQAAAFALYHQLKQSNDDLFFSPYSISAAFAMLYAGARGDTASQMATALSFTLPKDRLHPAFNRLDLQLHAGANRQDVVRDGDDPMPAFELQTVNQIWGQQGYGFEALYLDILAQHYGAGIGVWNFASDPEGGRRLINAFIADATHNIIAELLPPNSITSLTRMVLTNAIYFYGTWQLPFRAEATIGQPFHHHDGRIEELPMMNQLAGFLYGRGDNYQVIALPYAEDKADMVIWLPDEGAWDAVQEQMSADFVQSSVAMMGPTQVQLALPKWSLATQLSLRSVLEAMGMQLAFDPGAADLNGIADQGGLYVSDAVHKAYVRVDEKGTEAAAATGIVVGTTSMPVIEAHMTIDRSFMFAIRHRSSGALLFLGRYL